MTDTANKNQGLKPFLLRTLADPVLLYTVLLMMSIMYHYRSSLTFAYGVASYIIGWGVFRIFDFVNKHHILGFFACILLYGFSGYAALHEMEVGVENYPITWSLWFFTPQDSLKYNKWYTVALFILFLVFMLSVVYYFTRVRYRIFMSFLIFIIPFTIYGKEYQKMPIGFIIALAMGYTLMMVNFRQLSETPKEKIVNKPEVWKSVAVFMMIFALLSTLFPKPTVEEDRTILESLINAEALTDRLNQMLDVFRDTSDGEQFRSRQSNVIHYVVQADQPMRMKTATFSSYDFEKDSWQASDLDTHYKTYEEYPIPIDFSTEVADAVFAAAQLDADFAKKYGLEEYAGRKLTYPEKKNATVISRINFGGETVPVPEGVTSLESTNFHGILAVSRAAAVFTDDENYYMNDEFRFKYLPYTPLINKEDKALVDMFGKMDNYSEMLDDAFAVLDDVWRPDDETKHLRKILDANCAFYDTYTDILLDYNDDQRIYDLAQQITAGLDSEYDKAKAIEWYFVTNGYIYDLDYRKAPDENVDDFLFNTKTGVCVEYATAMVMLARASGIPARYCEGYLMNQEIEGSRGYYAISANDGHAFPELYIRGYGWVTFEPTMSNVENLAVKNTEKSSTTDMLQNAGYVLLAIAAAMLLLFVVMPFLMHKLFILINRKRSPDAAVAAVIHRLCKLYGIPPTNTADEACEIIHAASGADISATARLFNKSVYGEIPMTEADKAKAMEDYLAAYEALRESKKKKRKLKRSPQGGN